MFGQGPQREEAARPARPAAADVARIQGGGLVQLIVTNQEPFTFFMFLNGRPVPQGDVESFLVNIEVPAQEGGQPTVSATLTQFLRTVSGERSPTSVELFPCTVDLVAAGRRIQVTCVEAGSLEGAVINLGLLPNGMAREVNGVQSLRLLLTDSVVDATMTWTDGESEDLLAQTAEPVWPRHIN